MSDVPGCEPPARERLPYRALFDATPHPMWVYDLETLCFLMVNREAVRRYGYPEEEFLRMTLRDIRPEEDVPQLLENVASVSGGLDQRPTVRRHLTRGGRLIHVEITSHTLDFRGRPAELALVQDVTERVAREEETQRVLARLKESEKLLATAGRVARFGGWLVDLSDETCRYSDEVCRTFDLPLGARLPLEEAFALFPVDAQPEIRDRFVLCRDEGEPFDLELPAVTRSGRGIWVRTTGEPVRAADGTIIQVQGALQDISARRASESALRESEERFRSVARVTADAIWDWDLRTNQLDWSDGASTLFGYPPELLAQGPGSWSERIHPEDRPRVLGEVERVIQNGEEGYRDEYRFLRADGGWSLVVDRGHVLRDERGEPIRMVGGMTDITEQRRAEERIREQASLLDHARDAILVRTPDHTITYWNRGAERLYGWTTEEALGRSARRLIYPEGPGFEEAMAALLEADEWSGELAQRREDGSRITVECRWTLMRDADGAPQRILAINSDITEKKKLQAQFLRAQRMESIGTLAGGIAHDLNNVLAPIRMSVELLKDQVADADGLEILGTVETSAARGAEMVKQVLSFARGMNGTRVGIDPNPLLKEVVRILRDTFPKNIHVEVAVPGDAWKILGDPTQIHQVLLNLCVNARDAMPEGGRLRLATGNVVVDEHFAEMSGQAAGGPHVRIDVTDSGTGIPAGIVEQIFDPFFTTKEVGEGTGLGLATVQAIVRSHGGILHVQSEGGQGTTFQVYLPADPSDVARPAPGREGVLHEGAGELVMVVDDEEAVRRVTRRTLEAHGYRVVTATDGAEAIALYARTGDEVALVLTDLVMPVMDGPAAVRALRRLNPRAKIVAASGVADDDELARARDAGADRVLMKPYTARRLLDVLHEALHGD